LHGGDEGGVHRLVLKQRPQAHAALASVVTIIAIPGGHDAF
jgi:hypothetical protein